MEVNKTHERLKEHPVLFASIGVAHTLFTAGVVFGWASMLPVLREEGIDLSPADFTAIFTHGAIGNYLSSLPFGYILDKYGPRFCGILASVLFALGLVLCSQAQSSVTALNVGFALLGFSGPAIQLPTLHLARLFKSNKAALFMSAQAGAFDGGTIVFALFGEINHLTGLTTETFFRLYLIVPIATLLTAIFYWPSEILPDPASKRSYVGAGSPYLSPASTFTANSSLRDKPLPVIFSKPPFWCLATWVSVHILKLNFVVASINDQIDLAFDSATADALIRIFGAMLPFGFVVLPGVAAMLSRSTMACFQIANIVGVLYGVVLTFQPGQAWYQVLIVFSAVATSRQLVYSTVFHQTGELFGFRNYGVLLGLINVMVSSFSLIQGPLVDWAESRKSHYFYPNFLLLFLTLPLFVIVLWAVEKPPDKKGTGVGETMSLLGERRAARPRTMSDVIVAAEAFDA